MKIDVTKKFIILIVGVLLATALVIYFIIIPTTQEIRKISQAVFNERLDLERKYQRGQLLKKITKDFEEVKVHQGRLENAFVVRGDELTFITALETVAQEHEVTQDINLQIQKTEKKSLVTAVPLTLTAEGSFTQVMAYLTGLEQLPYYINFTQINFNKSTINAQTEAITINLQGFMYLIEPES